MILETIREMMPTGTAVAWASPLIRHATISREEDVALGPVSETRRVEFTTGRILAREVLAQLGVRTASILPAPTREPIWPAGVVGSIAHSQDACLVVAAHSGRIRGIGVDVESATPLEDALWAEVCTTRELAELQTFERSSPGLAAKLLFCTKEAFYKFQFPLTRKFLEFRDVEIDFGPEDGQFTARSKLVVVGGEMERAQGRFVQVSGHFVTAAWTGQDASENGR